MIAQNEQIYKHFAKTYKICITSVVAYTYVYNVKTLFSVCDFGVKIDKTICPQYIDNI